MHHVNSYLQLVGTTEMWEDLVISESGARLIYNSSFLLRSQLRNYSVAFRQNWVYIIVSLISKWAYLINGLLLNLQQSIPFTVGLCYPNSESLSLPTERGGVAASIQILLRLLQWGVASLLPSWDLSVPFSLQGGGGPLSSRELYIISHRLLTSKIKSKISISQSLIFFPLNDQSVPDRLFVTLFLAHYRFGSLSLG